MLVPILLLGIVSNPIGDSLAAPFRVRDSSGFIDVDIGHAAPLVADFDGDGVPDLLVGQLGEGRLRIYKNVGTAREPKFYGFTWFKTDEQEARIPSGGCIGFGPQFADLDGDGIPDIVSGSYSPGNIYFYRGLGKGQFARGEKLRFTGGLPVRAGLGSAVALADWDRDGRIDLIVGNINGQVSFLPNQSKDGQLFFGPGQPVLAGGKAINVDNDAGPLVTDWNGDGIPDLLVGASDGSISFFAGSGKTGVPRLSEGKTLVSESPDKDREPILRERDPKTGEWMLPVLDRPSLRPKLAVYDWNGDGRLDLLVGDAVSMTGAPPVLDDAKKNERDDLEKQSEEVGRGISSLRSTVLDRVRKELRAQNPETDESTLGEMAWEKSSELLSRDDLYCELTTRHEWILTKLSPLKGDRSTHGFVWVYLRTADARSADARSR